jgi:hypothetical protein
MRSQGSEQVRRQETEVRSWESEVVPRVSANGQNTRVLCTPLGRLSTEGDFGDWEWGLVS